MNGINSGQRLTSIPVSESVEFQLTKIMKADKSYSKVIQTLITNYWKQNGNWNNDRNTMEVEGYPAKSLPSNPDLNSKDTSLRVDCS
jgi:hypothetical protein